MTLTRFFTRSALALGVALGTLTSAPTQATAQDYFLGTINAFAFNFCPRGWTAADGKLLPISSNTALFSLYGTFYGGDGRTTFAMPDLRGRIPVHEGRGPGLSNYRIGSKGGVETVTLTPLQIPSHTHTMFATADAGTSRTPTNQFPARPVEGTGNSVVMYSNDTNALVPMRADMLATSGGGQGHENRPPLLALQWCVATQGTYPSRS